MGATLTFLDYAQSLVTLAAVVVGLGVIYQKVVRPIARAAAREIELFEWMHEQFDARDREGRLRDQIDRIEQRLDDLTRQDEEDG